MLLVHGFPCRWSTWRDILPALADEGYLAVAPDLRGYGSSDRPAGVDSYSVSRFVEDVLAIIDAHGRDRVFLVGHDLGGGVASMTAMNHAERITRLAILSSVHLVGLERQIRKWSQFEKSWYVFFFLLPWLPEWWLSRKDFRLVRRSLADDGLSSSVVDDLIEGVRPPGAPVPKDSATTYVPSRSERHARRSSRPSTRSLPIAAMGSASSNRSGRRSARWPESVEVDGAPTLWRREIRGSRGALALAIVENERRVRSRALRPRTVECGRST